MQGGRVLTRGGSAGSHGRVFLRCQESHRLWVGCGAEAGREHLSKGLSAGENHREDDEARGKGQLGPDAA